jgi:hypothetical protein
VHIATTVEVCEQRDRKGLYAKARAGILKEFTRISTSQFVDPDAVCLTKAQPPSTSVQSHCLKAERLEVTTRHLFLPAWKRQNMRQKTLHTVTCYPLLAEGGARHRLVQNPRSRSNSETALLYPDSS